MAMTAAATAGAWVMSNRSRVRAPIRNGEELVPAVVEDVANESDDTLPQLVNAANVVHPDGIRVLGQPGWRLARRCGLIIREKMGNPDLTAANRIVATTRVSSWLDENCPTLRASIRNGVLNAAVQIALTPTSSEVHAAYALQSREAVRRRHEVTTVHGVPVFAVLPKLQAFLGITTPACQNF